MWLCSRSPLPRVNVLLPPHRICIGAPVSEAGCDSRVIPLQLFICVRFVTALAFLDCATVVRICKDLHCYACAFFSEAVVHFF